MLNLSNNHLSGEIPLTISSCYNLEVLKLDNNWLRGRVPQQLNRLRIFSVANNSGLCGEPLEDCKDDRWAAFEVSFKRGFVVGFVLFPVGFVLYGYIAFLVYSAFLGYFALWVEQQAKFLSSRENKGKEVDQATYWPTKGVHQEESIKVPKLQRMVTEMSLTEISEATGNFSIGNVIGLGKIGVMYKGVLSNGRLLAIKRLHDSQSFEKQFVSELLTLGILRHNNIVPLLGYCREKKETLLVYKYISNGNLCDWLHAAKRRDRILEWPLRIKIAIGIARGLAWLHHECNFQLVHLNLSSNSILLDQSFEPKISNFGGAIISNYGGELFKNPRSNNIFVGSEVWELGYVKKDVYDFGILLLELIIRVEPIQIDNYSNNWNGSLIDWIAHPMTSSSDLYNFLRIACTCLKLFPSQRPTTLELYNTIRIFGERYGITSNSEILRQSEFDTASTSNEIVEAEITLAD
ncbi:probably inactive leucine-rich repeat receptor-like protein kinase At5g48380 [Fagus crenata]